MRHSFSAPLHKLGGPDLRKNRSKIWFEQAGFDLLAANISNSSGFYEWGCFQSTQAVEKALKALLTFSGWNPPKTHKLSVLIGLCNNANHDFRKVKFIFRDLEIYTFIARYPFLLPGESRTPHDYIADHEAVKCIEQADDITQKIEKLLVSVREDYIYEDFENIHQVDAISRRIDLAVANIVREIDPEYIVLFGGYGRGEDIMSTLDFLIIAQSDLSFVDRIRHVREITKGGLPVVEPVVYTPAEFDAIKQHEDFLCNAIREGKVLYTRQGVMPFDKRCGTQ